MKPLFSSPLIIMSSPLMWNMPTGHSSKWELLMLSPVGPWHLQRPWLLWQQHHWGCGWLPRPPRCPAKAFQGAIPDGLLGWPSRLLTGRLLSGLSVLVLLGPSDLHLCSHSDICFNLATPWIYPRIPYLWLILSVPPGHCPCSNTS